MTVKIKMGKISYINAFPVYYGMDHGLCPQWLELIPDVPAVLNRKIKTGQIHISPISSAFYAMNHEELLILPDLSISSHGKVLSVLLASRCPLDQLDGKTVLLSNESATAASLVKLIFARRDVHPIYQTGPVNQMNHLKNSCDAVLVIGDSALTQPWSYAYPHITDLGQLWLEMTGLPFVFALWVVRKDVVKQTPEWVAKAHDILLASRKMGDDKIEAIVAKGVQTLGLEPRQVQEYFDRLYCDLDAPKLAALDLFFTSLFEQGILESRVTIEQFNPENY